MRIFARREEEGGRAVLSQQETVQPQRHYRLQPTYEEVAEYAQQHKMHTSTDKLREAYRIVRKQRLQSYISQINADHLLTSILSEIIELL